MTGSTKYSKSDKVRIKVRKRAIEMVEADVDAIDKRLVKLFDQLAKTRLEHNADLMQTDMGKKKQDARINLFQNNILEFQHEIAELYARKRELREELVRRGEELAVLIADITSISEREYLWYEDPVDDVGC